MAMPGTKGRPREDREKKVARKMREYKKEMFD